LELPTGLPGVIITETHQSGKPTLVKTLFPSKPYILLEDPDTRRFAEEETRGFLSQLQDTGAIHSDRFRFPDMLLIKEIFQPISG